MVPRHVFAMFLIAVSPLLAWADLPDPTECSVTPADQLNGVVLCPEASEAIAASKNHIIVKYQGAPIANATVVVTFNMGVTPCPGATLTATTDAQGECDVVLSGGGCLDMVASAAVIRVNGVVIRAYPNAKSPDFAGGQSDGRVNLADLVAFSQEFNGQAPAECHDYTNDEVVNLSDLMIFSEAFVRASHCP